MDRTSRILVVDDEAGMRTLLSEVLQTEGFEVCLAKDGQESLERMLAEEFDLVITDIQMPVLDGIEMMRSMKRSNRRERVIVMSGQSPDLNTCRSDLPQVVMQFQKPFKLDRLLEAVHTATESGARLAASAV